MKSSASERRLTDKNTIQSFYQHTSAGSHLQYIRLTRGIYFFDIFAFSVLLHTPTEKRDPTDLLIWVSAVFT